MAGQPKAPFYLAVAVVVGGLVGLAVWQSDLLAPKAKPEGEGQGGPIEPKVAMTGAEDPNTTGITTVSEYEFVSAERLKEVQGTSEYKPLQDRTVRFALNVWAGWAPIIHANGGGQPGKIWKDANGEDFKVELVLIDDPKVMQDAFVQGEVHIGWGTLDMLPLFMERLIDDQGKILDSRVMPRVIQQVDWSNGGDGIVVRESIKEVRDLRGKSMVLAQNSPSHYFALNMLVAAGVQPSEVQFRFTPDAFKAAAAFESEKSIDACVSWAPDIYNLTDVAGNKMLVNTGTANRLIADVWFARADFARDEPALLEGLVRGIFDSMEQLKSQDARVECAAQMAALYDIPKEETLQMFADAYSTGWGDNFQFFVNQNYLANFERVWDNAYYLYRRINVITKPKVSFDQVMDNSFIKKLGEEAKYKSQVPQKPKFMPHEVSESQVEAEAFLTTTHYLHFAPNSWDLYKRMPGKGDQEGDLYDPNVDFVLEKIGERIEQFGLSRIVIEGHTDASMEGKVDDKLVKELSQNRAQAVRDALIDAYKLDANRFTVRGVGWERPADPGNHAKNRRVEVRILPAEG